MPPDRTERWIRSLHATERFISDKDDWGILSSDEFESFGTPRKISPAPGGYQGGGPGEPQKPRDITHLDLPRGYYDARARMNQEKRS